MLKAQTKFFRKSLLDYKQIYLCVSRNPVGRGHDIGKVSKIKIVTSQ